MMICMIHDLLDIKTLDYIILDFKQVPVLVVCAIKLTDLPELIK